MRRTVHLLLTPLLLATLAGCGGTATPSTAVIGQVRDKSAPVAGATVRIQTTQRSTVTDGRGGFTLSVEGMGPPPYRLTAWAPGYFCAGPIEAQDGQQDVLFELHAHATEDNADYAWLPSIPNGGSNDAAACAACHASESADPAVRLPVDEWLLDAHGRSTENPRFRMMYLGTDAEGNASPPTRYVNHSEYGRIPLPPDASQPYFGPGYKLDFPDTAGNCACCHAPAAAVSDPYGIDPTTLTGVDAEGIPCDFCHKVWTAELEPSTGLPYENRPGVLSFTFLRPPEGEQLFAGPFDDVAPGEDTCLPLQSESAFCAPCHHGVFWGVTIYDSFGEWLASPYSDPATGQTCQDCHMPRRGATHFVRPDQGGLQRDPLTLASHLMPGARDEALLQDALALSAEARWEGATVVVDVAVANDKTGHKVPTDSPLRHVILHVQAEGEGGVTLLQTAGPTIPAWGGLGDPAEGNYGGLPGTAYALVLEELWTEISPSGAYWNPTRVLSDTRLSPFATDAATWRFSAPSGPATVTVRLIYRRAFIELMRQKGWTTPDVLMEEVVLRLP